MSKDLLLAKHVYAVIYLPIYIIVPSTDQAEEKLVAQSGLNRQYKGRGKREVMPVTQCHSWTVKINKLQYEEYQVSLNHKMSF